MIDQIITNNLITITSAEVTRINNVVKAYDAQTPALAKAQAELTTANTALTKAQTDLVTANQKAKDQAVTIAKLEAQLASGGGSTGPTGPTDPIGSAGVMKVVGKQLYDASGNPFLMRGIEGWFGPNALSNVSGWMTSVASSGCNAFRAQTVIPSTDLASVEKLIQGLYANKIVYYANCDAMTDHPDQSEWFGRPAVQTLLKKYESNLIIDASIEDEPDAESSTNVVEWVASTKALIQKIRGFGYKCPILVGTLNSGRYLKGLLDHGQEFVDADPLKSVIPSCQMYWGQYSGGFSYHQLSGFAASDQGLRDAFAAISQKSFLIQLGLDAKDSGGNWAPISYELQMTLSQQYNIGTMWWQMKDPGDNDPNSLYIDSFKGSVDSNLTALGKIVLNTNTASIKKTSKRYT